MKKHVNPRIVTIHEEMQHIYECMYVQDCESWVKAKLLENKLLTTRINALQHDVDTRSQLLDVLESRINSLTSTINLICSRSGYAREIVDITADTVHTQKLMNALLNTRDLLRKDMKYNRGELRKSRLALKAYERSLHTHEKRYASDMLTVKKFVSLYKGTTD